jgi:hypothetical protein
MLGSLFKLFLKIYELTLLKEGILKTDEILSFNTKIVVWLSLEAKNIKPYFERKATYSHELPKSARHRYEHCCHELAKLLGQSSPRI